MNQQSTLFTVEKLLASQGQTEVFLATRNSDGRQVVLKSCQQSSQFLSPTTSDKLHSEFSILQDLEHDNIVQALALDTWEKKQILVRSYFDGIPLREFLSEKPLALPDFLGIAINLAETLNSIHSADIIHRNLNPTNILIDPNTKSLFFIGFGYAARKHQTHSSNASSFPEGDQSYWPPEQSGRMNRKVDFRTDIYSFGIILYQMLSGFCPFQSKDSIGLIHNHIAKTIPLLTTLNDDIPNVISQIINKMIAKNPDDRYQGMHSLIDDLKTCAKALSSEQPINDFEIDKRSNSGKLFKIEKIYHREAEIAQLIHSYKDACDGSSVLALLKGPSGIGKSSIVKAAREQGKSNPGNCINAKFDQFKRNTPFEMLTYGLRDLVRSILGESDETVSMWKEQFCSTLGKNAQLIINIIPEVELITGSQPPIQNLPAVEAKIRLNTLLSQFIKVFCRPGEPLCIFLDDLQWADIATLELLETVLFDSSYLLIIAAYRPDEMARRNYPITSLENFQIQDGYVKKIDLDFLPDVVINQMVADNLQLAEQECIDLATVVYNKTRGNPFFVMQYFQQLEEDGILWFDSIADSWKYDIEKVNKTKISENVVELLSGRIASLPAQMQLFLKTAACAGNQFDRKMIQLASELDGDINQYIKSALTSGWIIELPPRAEMNSETHYSFSHDRLQQAAWSLLSQPQIQAIHLKIGLYMLEMDKTNESEYLLTIVNYLNTALPLIEDQDIRLKVGNLNFQACLQTKHSGSFANALSYIKLAMDIFSATNADHLVTAWVIGERAECEHLCGNNHQAEIFYQQAVSAASSSMEKAFLYEMMIQFHTDLAQFNEAYSISRTAMSLFDINLPVQFNKIKFAQDFLNLKFQLRHYKTSDLVNLPQATDTQVEIIIRILSATLKVAYQIKPELCVAISIKLLSLCLKYGNTRESVIGYMVFGVIFMGGIREKHQTGYEYGQLSLALLDKYNNSRQKAEVNFLFGYFANSWIHSASNTETYWNTAYNTGFETGDWFHTGCACSGIVQSLFMRGIPLEQILLESGRFQQVLKRINGQEQSGAVTSVRQAILCLQGKTSSRNSFSDERFDEAHFVKSLKNYGSRHFAHYYFINKMTCLYLHNQYHEALDISHQSARYLSDSIGMLHSVEHYFYTALIIAKLYPDAKGITRSRWFKTLKGTEKKLHVWAQQCPDNFLSRYYLVHAEIFRLQGKINQAFNCYEEANQVAEKYGHLQLLALANDLTAHLYEQTGQTRSANYFKHEAAVNYHRWGANFYRPALFSELKPAFLQTLPAKSTQGVNSFKADDLDVVTLIKSAEAISEQRRLPDLLQTLMNIIIENAGAQRGVLLLKEAQVLVVQAEATLQNSNITVLQNIPYPEFDTIPHSIINLVFRTKKPVVLDNALNNSIFSQDDDVTKRKILSVLCNPLMIRGELKGIIYLENNASGKVFSENRLSLLQHLSGQIGISIENALIYENLEGIVQERTNDIEKQKTALAEKNVELESQYTTILQLNSKLAKENKVRSQAEMELQQVNEQLHHLSITDTLTQLRNRRHLDEYLHQECSRLNRDSSRPLALFLCDIDYFKPYNDCYGHQAGDECLKKVAQVLRNAPKRPSDLVARYGGEEFALIFPHTAAAAAIQIAQKIHENLAALTIPHDASSIGPNLTISIGIVIANPSRKYTPDRLLKTADDALYKAKENGRNQTESIEIL